MTDFTETLKDYRENGGEMYQTLFGHFPAVVVDNTLSLSMYNLFLDIYDNREIGCETEEQFAFHLKQKIEKLLVEYVPKINMFMSNFEKLFDFKIKLEYSNGSSGNSQDTYYLNPISSTTTNLKTQSVDGSMSEMSNAGEREMLQNPFGKTRPYVIDEIMKLKNVYLDCLEKFEDIFMGLF